MIKTLLYCVYNHIFFTLTLQSLFFFFLQYTDLLQEMKTLYSTAKVCPYNEVSFDRRFQELDELQEVQDYDLNSFGDNACNPTFSLEPGKSIFKIVKIVS